MRAKNQGLQQLAQYEYKLLLEGDVEVLGDSWPYACMNMCNSGYKAIMGRVKLPHKDGTFLSKSRIEVGNPSYLVPISICPDFLMKFAFLHRDVVNRIGGIDQVFDASWGAYADIDYGVRAIQAGFTRCPFAIALETPYLEIKEVDDPVYEKEYSALKRLAVDKNKDVYLNRRRDFFGDKGNLFSQIVV